ncbi:MAG: phosphonate C-P lyase system protein PhnL [Arenicella sp.]
MLHVNNLHKTFTLHNQGSVSFDVLKDVSFTVDSGECVVLSGASGSGKSTLMRTLYANYLPQAGSIIVQHQGKNIEMVHAHPHQLLQVRRYTMGYISQFLRVIPRVSALQIVMQPLLDLGESEALCRDKAVKLLTRLNVPEHLWSLAPATFSGGEQQRVNIARGFIVDYPILLLDEPTASLDAGNRQVVVQLIEECKQRGAAVIGIFHDEEVRNQVADREFLVQ